MNKNGFIWIFFKKEVLGFIIGLVVGIILTYGVAKGMIPIGISVCS